MLHNRGQMNNENILEIEVDLDDLLSNPFNSQPPSLNDLQRLTGFQKTWLIFIYRNFKQVTKSSSTNKQTFPCRFVQMAE